MHNPFPHFDGFRISEAIPFEEGVTRRDPSPVIQVDGLYHVWYSRNVAGNPRAFSGFSASVWHATSEDGVHWEEQAEAISKGGADAFDACGVYTPTVLVAGGMYYLYYTAVPQEWPDNLHTTCSAIGAASAPSPFGPWTKAGGAMLRCNPGREAFDSLRVDDTCIIVRDGGYWMYYKGRPWGQGADATKMGLARSTHPLGPWEKYAGNPVLDSGHEVCVWPHETGVGCLVCNVGPQGNTLQYSEDGIHFTQVANAKPPKAPGPFRADLYEEGKGPGITWGLAMVRDGIAWPYLLRFDCDLRAPSSCKNTSASYRTSAM